MQSEEEKQPKLLYRKNREESLKKIALIGTPNCGKSSLFNLLTGLSQRVGNYAGVTVEKKTGKFEDNEVIDIPGINQLWANTPDEAVCIDAILLETEPIDAFIYVANSNQVERSLLLFSQIADLQTPMIFVFNFKDELVENGIEIDTNGLAKKLGCPVILTNSLNGEGVDELKDTLREQKAAIPHGFLRSRFDHFVSDDAPTNTYIDVVKSRTDLDRQWNAAETESYEQEILARKHIISGITTSYMKKSMPGDFLSGTLKLDNVLLHPIWGTLFLWLVFFVIFQIIYNISAWPMDLMDQLFAYLSELSLYALGQSWFSDMLSNGVIPGLGGVLIFIPQIALLFFLIGILESTGYMGRISFLSDKLMRKFGLSGSSIIPLLSGVACAIPAVMSTRTISNFKERMIAIFVTPLVTCSARLPVYAILIALIIPAKNIFGFLSLQGLILFGMYILGFLGAFVFAIIMSRLYKAESVQAWTIDLPRYRLPNWRNVFTNTFNSVRSFVTEAGKVILVISMILWAMTSYGPHDEAFIEGKVQEYTEADSGLENSPEAVRLEYSYAGYVGKSFEPVIEPLGYDWKIGIALLSSFAAREVFVGALSTIYSVGSEENESIIGRLRSEKIEGTGQNRFNLATCLSLLVFYAFAMQCMSTLAVVKKETNSWRWPILQLISMTLVAYLLALLVYQLVH